MDILKLDKNLAPVLIGDQPFQFYDVDNKPFKVEGFPWRKKGQHYHRLPERSKGKFDVGGYQMRMLTPGCCVRFRTDSPKLAIRAVLIESCDTNTMNRTAAAGFDFYLGKGKNMVHVASAGPDAFGAIVLKHEITMERLAVQSAPAGMNSWLVNFPLYGGVVKLEIGVVPGSRLEAPFPHKLKKPILFYGSSITEGGSATRPGMVYTSMLCRTLDAEQINFGNSGSCMGAPGAAEMIAELDLAAFVMDYDHNAPDAAHLRKTHEKFFRILRKARPDLPIIILSRCDVFPELNDGAYRLTCERRDVIRKTYEHAIEAGDKNVYFIDGATLFGKDFRSECTVDHCHPNDLGFYRMYQTILPVLRKAIRNAGKKS